MITELKVGDYIEKSELSTEQKYNDVVGVFSQWGAASFVSYKVAYYDIWDGVILTGKGLSPCFKGSKNIIRKLTYDQIMSLKKVDVDNLNIDKVVSNEEIEDDSELLKLHAAADGLIRLGYVWDEEEKAWCKISKEYL